MNTRDKNEVRREIGMLFQGGALFDSLTVEENVRFPLDMFTNLSLSDKVDRVNEVLKRVNLVNANHTGLEAVDITLVSRLRNRETSH